MFQPMFFANDRDASGARAEVHGRFDFSAVTGVSPSLAPDFADDKKIEAADY